MSVGTLAPGRCNINVGQGSVEGLRQRESLSQAKQPMQLELIPVSAALSDYKKY